MSFGITNLDLYFVNCSILGATSIVCGLYAVLWGKDKEMKEMSQLSPQEIPEDLAETILTITSTSNNNNAENCNNRVTAIDKNLSNNILGKEDRVHSQEQQMNEKAKDSFCWIKLCRVASNNALVRDVISWSKLQKGLYLHKLVTKKIIIIYNLIYILIFIITI